QLQIMKKRTVFTSVAKHLNNQNYKKKASGKYKNPKANKKFRARKSGAFYPRSQNIPVFSKYSQNNILSFFASKPVIGIKMKSPAFFAEGSAFYNQETDSN